MDFSKPAATTAQTQEIVVAKSIPCHQWREATLLLREQTAIVIDIETGSSADPELDLEPPASNSAS